MIARRVHAAIAAGLKDPHLLLRWQRQPKLLRDCGLDPKTIDLAALLKFAGLTTKVRHNGLRADIPSTFRFLSITGLEIEVFSAYATFHAGKSLAPTVQARSAELLLFLEQWLDFEKREHALLYDLMRHELALAQLRKLETSTPDLSSVVGQPRASSRPKVHGDIILHEMRSDPRVVQTLLSQKNPRLEEAPSGTFYFCYWRQKAEDIYVLELDALGFYLVSNIDGKRTAAELSSSLCGNRRTPKALLQSLAELAAVGIVVLG